MNNSKFYRNLCIALGVILFIAEVLFASQFFQLCYLKGWNSALDFAQFCGTVHVAIALAVCLIAFLVEVEP